jgi:phosphonate transport system ATP-binding protein
MRLIREVCAERNLPAIINIHDVLLAQAFVDRIVGLRAGEVVFDGPPAALAPEILTRIYGEEDWTALQRRHDDETEDESGGEDKKAADVEIERRASLA